MLRTQQQPAFILHTRPYRNTSLIVDILTRDYGRITAVAKSARGPKSRYRGILQTFTPLLIDFYGSGELKTLGNVELTGVYYVLKTKRLFCAYYLNEILLRLLAKDDPVPKIFSYYRTALDQLANLLNYESALREFELDMLSALGVLVSFVWEYESQKQIQADNHYQLIVDRGFHQTPLPLDLANHIYLGADILSIEKRCWLDLSCLRSAKHILRQLISAHIGPNPIHSRRLIRDIA